MKLRENVLLLYMAFIGTVFGIALRDPPRYEILLVVPFLAFGVSSLVAAHHELIGALNAYCARELEAFLSPNDGSWPTPYDRSLAIQTHLRFSLFDREWVHLIVFLVPAIPSLWVNFPGLSPPFSPILVLWGFSLLAALLATWFVLRSFWYRKRLHDAVLSEGSAGLAASAGEQGVELDVE